MSSQKEDRDGKSKKSEDYDKSATVKVSNRQKRSEKEKEREPNSNLEDPTSKKQTGIGTGTGRSTGTTGGATDGASKKETDVKGQTDSARLTAKADELLKHARTPMKSEKDDLTHRIMALSPSTTIAPKKEKTEEEAVDRSETAKGDMQEERPLAKKKTKGSEKKENSTMTTTSGSNIVSKEKDKNKKRERKTASKEDAHTEEGSIHRSVLVSGQYEYKSWIDHKIIKRLDKMRPRTQQLIIGSWLIFLFTGGGVGIYAILDATLMSAE